MRTPDNFVLHAHDGFYYAFALNDRDELVRASAKGIYRTVTRDGFPMPVDVGDFNWRAVEIIEHEGEIRGENDARRFAYCGALHTTLMTTKRRIDIGL